MHFFSYKTLVKLHCLRSCLLASIILLPCLCWRIAAFLQLHSVKPLAGCCVTYMLVRVHKNKQQRDPLIKTLLHSTTDGKKNNNNNKKNKLCRCREPCTTNTRRHKVMKNMDYENGKSFFTCFWCGLPFGSLVWSKFIQVRPVFWKNPRVWTQEFYSFSDSDSHCIDKKLLKTIFSSSISHALHQLARLMCMMPKLACRILVCCRQNNFKMKSTYWEEFVGDADGVSPDMTRNFNTFPSSIWVKNADGSLEKWLLFTTPCFIDRRRLKRWQ